MTDLQAPNLIGGQWLPAASGAFAASVNPADGTCLGYLADSGESDARAAISAARQAFENPDWSQNPRLRQMVMLRWADRIEACAAALAELLTQENGKVLVQARAEIAGAVSEIRYYAGLARHIPGHALEVEPGVFSTMLKEPAGVAGLIIPWNAPVVLLVRALAPALAAGCTCVIKPAAQTALISTEIIRALHADEALPAGVVNQVNETGNAVARSLVASTDVDVISFTGSNAVGQRIMADAAPTMKKLSLELGGKSCCVVFGDADIADVAPQLARAATVISGQQCTAARRVLVHRSRYAEMKQALAQSLRSLEVGPGLSPAAGMGPLIDGAAVSHVSERVAAAMDIADEVIVRGGRLGGGLSAGNFMTPTLVAQRDTSAFFVQEEIFGPFVVLESFDDEAEAVARANHSEFGLSASVWTNDGARGWRIARALRNGTVWLNDHNKLFAEAETGGYRRSGIGRLHGYDALIDFVEVKHIYQSVGTIRSPG